MRATPQEWTLRALIALVLVMGIVPLVIPVCNAVPNAPAQPTDNARALK